MRAVSCIDVSRQKRMICGPLEPMIFVPVDASPRLIHGRSPSIADPLAAFQGSTPRAIVLQGDSQPRERHIAYANPSSGGGTSWCYCCTATLRAHAWLSCKVLCINHLSACLHNIVAGCAFVYRNRTLHRGIIPLRPPSLYRFLRVLVASDAAYFHIQIRDIPIELGL
ncbi:hypothetical protein BC628DRAFT_1015156 [Trametes gibbosa]|nr:hypothetical protein BC628DRAFT_1015156 [Trametes gibbosa]